MSLHSLDWLVGLGCEMCSWTCRRAAEYDQLEVMKFYRSKGGQWNEDACKDAAEKGHLEILKWMRQPPHPSPWDKRVCSFAALGGQLEVLKWLRSEGCEWDEETCHFAAQGGHIEVLEVSLIALKESRPKYIYHCLLGLLEV